uniref:Uncharacterized protein n=1 Tax=Arundo donax TaxID=35708 RepID=A0A0A9DSM6_ARUDO
MQMLQYCYSSKRKGGNTSWYLPIQLNVPLNCLTGSDNNMVHCCCHETFGDAMTTSQT